MGNSLLSAIEWDRRCTRGQSEVLGIVLLFAIVLLVSVSVIVVGTSSLQEARSSTMDYSAETSMNDLQSSVEQLERNGGSRTIKFADSSAGGGGVAEASTGGSVSVNQSAGSINITIIRDSEENDTMSRRLGTVTYEGESGDLLYQGGGVFRLSDGGGSTIVSPPDFQYQNSSGSPTLRLALTNVTVEGARNERSLGDEVTVRGGDQYRWNDTAAPLTEKDSVNITVESRAYEAWEELFRERTNGTVSTGDFDNDNQGEDDAARVTLNGAGESANQNTGDQDNAEDDFGTVIGQDDLVANGTLVTTEPTSLSYSNHANAVSYNSSNQPVGQPPGGGTNAPVYINGSLETSNHVFVDGDLIVEKRADISSNDNAQQTQHIEGETIIGGVPEEETVLDGHLRFGGNFSTGHDLKVTGRNSNNKLVEFKEDVYVGGNVTEFSNVIVGGDLYVEGDISFGSGVTVNGDVQAGGDINGSPSNDDPEDVPEPAEPELPSLSSVNNEINWVEDNLSSSNDNGNATDGTINTISSDDCNPCTLSGNSDTDGTSDYYIEDGIDLSNNEKLVFDTSSGPIRVYTNGVDLNKGQIEVHGDNYTRIFNGGDMTITGDNAVSTYDATGSTETYRAPNFRVFMKNSNSVNFGGGEFTGVVYGPGGTDVTFSNNVNIYGAVVGDTTDIPNHVIFHFDEALLSAPADYEKPGDPGPSPPSPEDPDSPDTGNNPSDSDGDVSYFTVTTKQVVVDDDD